MGLQEVDGDYAGDAVEHLHATIGEGKHQFRMGAQKVQVDRERLVVFFEVPGVVVKGLGSRRAPHGSRQYGSYRTPSIAPRLCTLLRVHHLDQVGQSGVGRGRQQLTDTIVQPNKNKTIGTRNPFRRHRHGARGIEKSRDALKTARAVRKLEAKLLQIM